MPNRWVTYLLATAMLASACGGGSSLPGPAVVTFPISALGAEGAGPGPAALPVHGGESRHQGRPAGHAGRSRPEAPALRPMAQRGRQRSRYPAARRDLDARVRRRWMDPPARPLPARHRRLLPLDHRGQPVAGQPLRAAVVRRRGDAVLAHRSDERATRHLRRAGSVRRKRARQAGGPQYGMRLAGRPLRRTDHHLRRVSRRLRRAASWMVAGWSSTQRPASGP